MESTIHSPGRELLRSLLSERNQYPDRAAQIDEQLRNTFERKVSVLALDMCGFSRLTEEHGIIHYLAMIHQMEEASRPAVEGNGGKVIKQEADNLFAIFEEPVQALEASLDIFRAFDAINSVVPDERDIYGSIGIGYGEMLIIGEEDLYGSEMNMASKLGEDIACRQEILVTSSAYAELPEGFYKFAPVSYSISGMDIDCYRYEGRVHPKTGKLDLI